jgi:hypothetical protein
MTERFTTMACVLAVVACPGCGGGNMPAAVPAPPHGGEMFALPAEQGWVELRNEEEKGIGKVRRGVIAAYFFKLDRQTPLAPPPTDVHVSLEGERGKAETVPLKAGAARTPGRFASEEGVRLLSDLPGELSGTLGGAPFSVKFRARR